MYLYKKMTQFTGNMQTIFAPINNHRNSAVCTIRVSGNGIFELQKFIPSLYKIKHKTVKRAKIFDESGSQLDDVIVLFFKAPYSFTGEDVLEVSLHASPFIVSKFLSLLASVEGFRFAKAGEFCLRAVENEKMTLSEAEAINKLIISESAVKHRLAISEMNGVCRDYYHEIKHKIIKILSLLETNIDFSEEEAISEDFFTKIKQINAGLVSVIEKTLKFSERQGGCDVQIAILGRPNVGKSTLFNAMTGTDDAIVSEIAGTTRDILKKTLGIGGFKIELVDTAGIRKNAEQIEKIGIERAKKLAMNADMVLLLKEDINDDIYDLPSFNGEVITVLTKADIYGVREEGREDIVNITRDDISLLEGKIQLILEKRYGEMQAVGFICNARQRVVLEKAMQILQGVNFSLDVELLAEEFRHALHTVSYLVGDVDNEDILGEIFSTFCIGK